MITDWHCLETRSFILEIYFAKVVEGVNPMLGVQKYVVELCVYNNAWSCSLLSIIIILDPPKLIQ
jgi:hypothetical protein